MSSCIFRFDKICCFLLIFLKDQLKKEVNYIKEYKLLDNEFEALMKDSARVWSYPIDNQLPW